MFESIVNNIKAHSAKVSESLTLDSLRTHTQRLSESLGELRHQTSKISDNIVLSLRRSTSSLLVNQDVPTQDAAASSTLEQNKCNLKWPVLVDNKMQWVTLPHMESDYEEEEDIVDRFIRVITLDYEKTPERRNDREEIRRRLAMGSDADEYYGGERPGRKPSLQARLQSGMNLQICFMNETVSDPESPSSDTESSSSPAKSSPEKMAVPRSHTLPIKQPLPAAPVATATRPSTSLLSLPLRREPDPAPPMTEADFFARQAQLQAEARLALAQAKEMAHMQMEVERQRQKKSPITEMVRSSLEKVGIPFPEDRRRVSRQLLTEMNVAQLQVIVNDLHTQIEVLNEGLVKFLMDRDDLHMEQDSMLVDIEDLTRYLGAKEQTAKEQKEVKLINQNNNLLTSAKPKITRIANLVKK